LDLLGFDLKCAGCRTILATVGFLEADSRLEPLSRSRSGFKECGVVRVKLSYNPVNRKLESPRNPEPTNESAGKAATGGEGKRQSAPSTELKRILADSTM
jgi:hypothetical protein